MFDAVKDPGIQCERCGGLLDYRDGIAPILGSGPVQHPFAACYPDPGKYLFGLDREEAALVGWLSTMTRAHLPYDPDITPERRMVRESARAYCDGASLPTFPMPKRLLKMAGIAFSDMEDCQERLDNALAGMLMAKVITRESRRHGLHLDLAALDRLLLERRADRGLKSK